MSIGQRVRALRRARLLTQAQLAQLAGTTQTEVSRWEAGRTQPQLGSLRRLCDALGVEPADLLDSTTQAKES